MDTFAVVVVIAIALGLRLRQRLPRRRQLDRDGRVDAGPVTAARCRSGRRSSTSSPFWCSARWSPPRSPPASSSLTHCRSASCSPGSIGAIGWNLITFYLGLPTSSSHALVGGIAGAAVAKAGFDVLIASGLRTIGVFIILSPLLGLALGMLLTIGMMWAVHRYRNVDRLNRGFRVGQLFSAAAFSLGHGGNDAQKTMGVILAVLISAGHLPTRLRRAAVGRAVRPLAIGLGTLTGGWRIVKTMGSKITRLQPVGGMAAEIWLPRHTCSSRRTPASRCRPRTRSPVASSA